jgi:hypothetical protein
LNHNPDCRKWENFVLFTPQRKLISAPRSIEIYASMKHELKQPHSHLLPTWLNWRSSVSLVVHWRQLIFRVQLKYLASPIWKIGISILWHLDLDQIRPQLRTPVFNLLLSELVWFLVWFKLRVNHVFVGQRLSHWYLRLIRSCERLMILLLWKFCAFDLCPLTSQHSWWALFWQREDWIFRIWNWITSGAHRQLILCQFVTGSILVPHWIRVLSKAWFSAATIGSVTFEAGAWSTQIDGFVFTDSSRKYISIPQSVDGPGRSWFANSNIVSKQSHVCRVLRNHVLSPVFGDTGDSYRSVEKLGKSWFGSRNIQDLTFHNEVKVVRIEELCFVDCSLGSIRIPRSIEILGKSSFQRAKIRMLASEMFHGWKQSTNYVSPAAY